MSCMRQSTEVNVCELSSTKLRKKTYGSPTLCLLNMGYSETKVMYVIETKRERTWRMYEFVVSKGDEPRMLYRFVPPRRVVKPKAGLIDTHVGLSSQSLYRMAVSNEARHRSRSSGARVIEMVSSVEALRRPTRTHEEGAGMDTLVAATIRS